MDSQKRAIKKKKVYLFNFRITWDTSAIDLLESGEQRCIKAIGNNDNNSSIWQGEKRNRDRKGTGTEKEQGEKRNRERREALEVSK